MNYFVPLHPDSANKRKKSDFIMARLLNDDERVTKSPRADLERQHTTSFLMGLIFVLALLLVALEWNSSDSGWNFFDIEDDDLEAELELSPLHRDEDEVPMMVPDNREVVEEVKSEEVNPVEQDVELMLEQPEPVKPEAVQAEEIDRLNILWASVTGMQRAVLGLDPKPEFLLIDGNRFRPFAGYGRSDYLTIVHGDATCASIAAASVLAKTYRDDRMRALALEYPGYGWERNTGYPTPEHIEAIRRLGCTPEHRKSFHPSALEPTLF